METRGGMSRRANCWDNAVAESFFSTLKIELAHDADWGTHADAHRVLRCLMDLGFTLSAIRLDDN